MHLPFLSLPPSCRNAMGRLCSRRHSTVGAGSPVALQASRILPPSCAELPSLTLSTMSGGITTDKCPICNISFDKSA